MFDEDEEHEWVLEEAENLGEHELFLERRTLRKFWERKGSCETEREVIWWRVEREISSTKVGVAFSNRDDEKILFTHFHSRVVSDHIYQQ